MRRPVRITERSRAAVVLCALVAIGGCAAAKGLQQPAAPVPTGAAPALTQVLGVLEAQDLALERFRAQARLDYHSPEQSFRSTQVLVVRAPSSARIDVMNPFGISYTVATDGKMLTAFDRRQGVYYQGQAQAESFRRFIGIPMSSADFAAVLRGLPPGLGDTRWSAVAAAEGGWLMRRRLGSGGVLDLVVHETTLLPRLVKVSGDRDRHEMEVTYGDYRDAGGVQVPHRIGVRFRDGTELEIAYKSVQRAVAFAADAFQVDRPAGSRFVDIDAGGGAPGGT